MVSRRTIALGFAGMVLAGAAVFLWQHERAVGQVTNGKTRVAKPRGRVLVTISKETTYITEPLRADGYPDYIGAVNQRLGKNVTPENNAAALLWKAFGPGKMEPKTRDKFIELLGIGPLPEKGDYFAHFDEFVKSKKKAENRATEPSDEFDWEKLWELQRTAGSRPWSKQELPLVAEWLAANEAAMALMTSATKRPYCYQPMVYGPDDSMASVFFTNAPSHCRESLRAFVARAMLRTHEGDLRGAWEDLLTCHRLARFVGQGPWLIDALVSITNDAVAGKADVVLLQHARIGASELAKMRADLERLPPMPKMADVIDMGERVGCLDAITLLARNGLGDIGKITGLGPTDSVATTALKYASATAIDWDVVLRMSNSWYDRFAAVGRKQTVSERRQALATLDRDLRAFTASSRSVAAVGWSLLANPRRAISDQLGKTLLGLFTPSLSAFYTVEDRFAMQFELTKLAFALAQYRAEHGQYPAKLAELVPKYVAAVPQDGFSDVGLNYRRDAEGYLLYSVGPNGKDDGGRGMDGRKDGEDVDDLTVRMPGK